mmetsp:Transcript_98659/g.120799  ORF Transcript_98659/g.120799 Transcript_98659/m.120799 type:complete len:220 (+) Transcript_98659:106-765(+)
MSSKSSVSNTITFGVLGNLNDDTVILSSLILILLLLFISFLFGTVIGISSPLTHDILLFSLLLLKCVVIATDVLLIFFPIFGGDLIIFLLSFDCDLIKIPIIHINTIPSVIIIIYVPLNFGLCFFLNFGGILLSFLISINLVIFGIFVGLYISGINSHNIPPTILFVNTILVLSLLIFIPIYIPFISCIVSFISIILSLFHQIYSLLLLIILPPNINVS